VNRPSETARSDNPAPARFNAAEFLRMADLGAFDVRAKVVHVMSAPAGDRYATRSTVSFGEPLALPQELGTIVLD
jgi:hypothetical protein